MSEYNIFMTHVASDDLRSITAYIANELREPTAAKRIVAKIKEVVMSLKKMPNRYSIIDEESLAIKCFCPKYLTPHCSTSLTE